MPLQPIPEQSQFADMPFPAKGIDLSVGFDSQTPGTTPVAVNVRLYEAQTQRGRGGSRCGLSQYIPEQLPSGPGLIQHLNYIVDPSGIAMLDVDDGDFDDPSSPGPPSSWGHFQHSRNPGRKLRRGGSARMQTKNKPRPLTITADDQTKVAGDTFTFAGTEFVAVGLDILDSISSTVISSKGAPPEAIIGNYPVKISNAQGLPSGKYKISYVKGNMSVTPRPLTITAKNQSKVFGATFTFTGTEFTSSGLQAPDTISRVTLTSAGAPASAPRGTYSIVPSAPVGLPPNKYGITFVNGTMQVGAIQFVQSASIGFNAVGASGSLAFNANVTAGNLLVVCLTSFNPSTAQFTLSDSQGNSYSIAGSKGNSDAGLTMRFCRAQTTGPCTVNVTWTGTTFAAVAILEYSGVNAVPLDAASVNGTNAIVTSMTTNSIPVAGTGELVIAAFAHGFDDATMTPGAGFTLRESLSDATNAEALHVEDQLNVGSATAATGTLSAANPYAAVGASFKPA